MYLRTMVLPPGTGSGSCPQGPERNPGRTPGIVPRAGSEERSLTVKGSYLISRVLIFDGENRPPKQGSVLVRDGFIERVGDIPREDVPEETTHIELPGLAVSPGFINMHSHSDTAVLIHPEASNLVRQGITTEVVGNCGSSACFMKEKDESRWERLKAAGIEEMWDGVRGYLDTVDAVKPAVNVATLVGHGEIRSLIAGDSGRPLDEPEKARMREIALGAVEEGAFGISSGLEYVPGRFADVEELAEISKGAAALGGIHASHIRNEGPELPESVREAIEVSRRSGVFFEIAHLKACGPGNWGKVAVALDMIELAQKDGVKVSADFYPYLASSTGLSIVLPDWVLEKGKDGAVAVLAGETTRAKAEAEADRRTVAQGGWDRIVITRVSKPKNKWMEGKDVATIARQLGVTPARAAVDLLLEEDMDVGIVRFAMSEEDLIEVMKFKESTVVTDGNVAVPEEGKVHPRSVGTFPRVLGYYARERGILSMEEAIYKMTGLPARKLGIGDRGLLRPGFRADLVVFDPAVIIDRATYENPWQYPVGIHSVFVNGEPVLWEGELTGRRPGQAVRKATST